MDNSTNDSSDSENNKLSKTASSQTLKKAKASKFSGKISVNADLRSEKIRIKNIPKEQTIKLEKHSHPGVYVEEIPSGVGFITQQQTSVAAFVGYTEKSEYNGQLVPHNTPAKINSFFEYLHRFGEPYAEDYSIIQTVTSSGSLHLQLQDPVEFSPFNMNYQIQLFFDNGGKSCYVVSIGTYEQARNTVGFIINQAALKTGLEALESVDDANLILVTEAISLTSAERILLFEALLSHCKKLDRFALLDVLQHPSNSISSDTEVFRSQLGTESLRYAAAYYPSLTTSITTHHDESKIILISEELDGRKRYLEDLKIGSEIEKTFYRQLKNELQTKKMTLYPSGAMAGIFARVDNERGVWKAPANVALRNVIQPNISISNDEQEILNVDVDGGKSINAIRHFTGKGNLIWGARTLAGNSNEWRYVSTQRLYTFLKTSITKGTEYVVFEPNNPRTWTSLKSMIDNFLLSIWKDGGLTGSKPEDAFYCKVGLGQTMSSNDILAGKLIIEVGFSSTRPAEFSMLRIVHILQTS